MILKNTLTLVNQILKNKRRCFHCSKVVQEKFENPLKRTVRILADDVNIAKKVLLKQNIDDLLLSKHFPKHFDVLIIGGGAIGSSVAYWLKERTRRDGISVGVIEKDPSVGILSNVCSLHFEV